MEDNNYKHEKFDDCLLCNHPVLKHIMIGIMVFLGAFAAFYVVSDWHFKRMYDPMYQMRRMDKAMMRQENRMDRMAKKEIFRQVKMNERAAQFIHVDKTKDAYKVIIDLTPFDNDEHNVEVKSEGKTLMINAAGIKNAKNKEEIVKYNQAFTFGDDVDLDDLTKIREGSNYIISIPIEK